ncbi:MAG TPA: hypothetical protein DD658_11950 [Deltaproteobacteria bacterium]|nr:hypothetical protein [Deltaproteobacteria bacterium]
MARNRKRTRLPASTPMSAACPLFSRRITPKISGNMGTETINCLRRLAAKDFRNSVFCPSVYCMSTSRRGR